MTTVIVTGVPAVHAAVRYHRRLGRYMVELAGEGVSVEFVLTGPQVRRLIDELARQAPKVRAEADGEPTARPSGRAETR